MIKRNLLAFLSGIICVLFIIEWRFYSDELEHQFELWNDEVLVLRNNEPQIENSICDYGYALSVSYTPGNNVVSYVLYGTSPRYTEGIPLIAKQIAILLPGWRMRVYMRQDALSLKPTLLNLGIEVIEVPGDKTWNGMSLRFLAATDPKVDHYEVRDIDSPITPREAEAILEWVESKKKFHILRDHPSHYGMQIMGGLWGGTYDKDLHQLIDTQLSSTNGKDGYMEDIVFLDKIVVPFIYNTKSIMTHDGGSCKGWGDPNGRGFTSPRLGTEHVGAVMIHGEICKHGRQGDCDMLNGIQDSPECRQKTYEVNVLEFKPWQEDQICYTPSIARDVYVDPTGMVFDNYYYYDDKKSLIDIVPLFRRSLPRDFVLTSVELFTCCTMESDVQQKYNCTLIQKSEKYAFCKLYLHISN